MNHSTSRAECNVESWLASADGFCGALFQRLAHGVPIVFDGERADYSLPFDDLPSADHRAVARAIIGHAEAGRRPTLESVRSVAALLGYNPAEKLANPHNSDLIDLLPVHGASGAALHFHARECMRSARKARQVARLHKALEAMTGGAPTPATTTRPAPTRKMELPRFTRKRSSAR